jgi:hypothetical protein
MSNDVIQDWTDTQVPLQFGDCRDVRYRIVKDGMRLLQEIRDSDGTLIRRLELPQGMALGKISFEASLRQVLTNVVTA